MHDLAGTRVGGARTLSPEERERLRRDGRVARALEAAQRRTTGRFSRITLESKAPNGDGRSGRRGG